MLGVMMDMSRNGVMKLGELKKFASILAKFGYDCIQLYTEDTYEVEGEPYFGYMRGRYTKAELREFDAYCASLGIELMPCIQTLAHTGSLFRWGKYRDIHDINDIMLIGEEKTYAFLDKLFATAAETFTSRRINIGMDEAHMVGLGKYLDKHGYRDRFSLLNEHLQKVIAIANKYGFHPMMWSDMYFRLANNGQYYGEKYDGDVVMPQEVIDSVPKGVDLIYWDYYSYNDTCVPRMLEKHALFKNKTVFAGGAWCWKGFVPDNKFTLNRMMLPAIKECKKKNIEDMIVTLWGDNGKECSFYAVLPSLYRIAKEWLKNNDETLDEIALKKEFNSMTGANFDDMMTLDDADYIDGAIEHETPSKYMLYNDVFQGIYDSTVKGDESEYYKKLKEKHAHNVSRNGEYGYLFNVQEKLCAVLEDKFCVGVKLRKAYQNKDREELIRSLAILQGLPKKVKDFYLAVKVMWSKENKPFGFEVQQHRLGGLIFRIDECAEKLEKYLSGDIESIDELETELLDVTGNEKLFNQKPIHDSCWSSIISVSRI